MSSVPRVIAKYTDDNPLLVCRRVSKELYVPTVTHLSRTVIEPRTFTENMPASQAREKGHKVDPEEPDTKIVKVEWVEDVERVVTWTETRLQTRGKSIKENGKEYIVPRRGSRPVDMRAELAEALDSPLSFIRYQKLQNLIKDEISHWKNNNIVRNIDPIVLVLLGLSENNKVEAFARDIYFIKVFGDQNMVVVDSHDNEIEIELEPRVFESGVISNFTLFLPSNVHIYDPATDDRLI